MKDALSRAAVLFLVFGLATAHAEIYSWVDRDGKKHFGEKVPKEYLSKSTELDVKPINAMDATKIPQKPKETEKAIGDQEKRIAQLEEKPTEILNACEQQKRAYEQSVQCYSRCRNREGSEENRVNNISACGSCVDAKKPDC